MHHDGLTFNRKPHFLVYADDFRLYTLHKNTEALLDTLTRVGPEVNTQTQRYSVVTYRQLIRRLDT